MDVDKQETLRRFERKILRRVYGPVKEDNERRIRNHQEMDELLSREDFVRFIKV